MTLALDYSRLRPGLAIYSTSHLPILHRSRQPTLGFVLRSPLHTRDATHARQGGWRRGYRGGGGI